MCTKVRTVNWGCLLPPWTKSPIPPWGSKAAASCAQWRSHCVAVRDSVELQKHWPQFSSAVVVGETTTTVAPFIPGGVSDGQWHSVQVQYYNKVREITLAIPLLFVSNRDTRHWALLMYAGDPNCIYLTSSAWVGLVLLTACVKTSFWALPQEGKVWPCMSSLGLPPDIPLGTCSSYSFQFFKTFWISVYLKWLTHWCEVFEELCSTKAFSIVITNH